MKFQYKIQQYQTDAVEAVVNVFAGQGLQEKVKYRRDIGKVTNSTAQVSLEGVDDYDPYDDTAYKNAEITLESDALLANIKRIQKDNNIKLSSELVGDLGACSLDIEMETGTGKTYVYIKTMFELNKRYGWSKFIVVVPSIAIREGVKKSFESTTDHFMEYYGKKARFFIYDSKNLNQLDSFSSDSGINVMIINTQAFAASLKDRKADLILQKSDLIGKSRLTDEHIVRCPAEIQGMSKLNTVVDLFGSHRLLLLFKN